MVSNQKLKWKSDFDKGVLIQNFEKRGWQKATGEGKLLIWQTLTHIFFILTLFRCKVDDWNIYWANPWTVKQIFNPETGHRLGETQ